VWSTATAYSNGIIDSAGGISADPLFVDADAGDFTLQEGSPAINAGLDQGYPYSGTAPDMGAFESGNALPTIRPKALCYHLTSVQQILNPPLS